MAKNETQLRTATSNREESGARCALDMAEYWTARLDREANGARLGDWVTMAGLAAYIVAVTLKLIGGAA